MDADASAHDKPCAFFAGEAIIKTNAMIQKIVFKDKQISTEGGQPQQKMQERPRHTKPLKLQKNKSIF